MGHPDNNYWSDNAGWRTGSANQVEALGSPGKYVKSLAFSGGQLDLTGSNYGYGALLMASASAGSVSLQDGGTIPFTSFSAGTLYELAVSQLSGSAVLATTAYVLKRAE